MDNFQSKKRLWNYIGVTIGVMLLFTVVFFITYNLYYQNKVYYRVKVGNIDLSGKTKNEVESLLKFQTEKYLSKNLKLTYGDQEWNLEVGNLVSQFDNKKTSKIAIDEGRSSNFAKNIFSQLSFIFRGEQINDVFAVNSDYYNQNIERIKSAVDRPLQESSLKIVDGQVNLSQGQKGIALDQNTLTDQIDSQIGSLSSKDIIVPTKEINSTVKEEELNRAQKEAEQIIAYPLTLKYDNFKQQVGSVELGNLIKFEVKPFNWEELAETQKYELDNYFVQLSGIDVDIFKASKLTPVLDQENTKAYLTKIADANINSKAQNATLEIRDGQVVVAKSETDGRVLDIDGTTQKISEALFDNGPRTINLNVVEQKAEVRSDNYQQMGIKELIGTGTSNFVGSPQNRIHNIDVGAAKVNGALVKPGELFSLDTQLGVIDASTGYLPELVIKENKTVPEYGGGLCQIGTTTFRAALNSSLPILERQNHAYIVQYYAPTGTDATIYPPHPDVIFKNNTNGYILIQTNISGNILTFDFYGTRGDKSSKFNGIDSQDGAVDRIENVNPHVYNQQPDGSAEAEFYRFIFEGGQLTKTERFYSKYDSPSKYPH